MAEKVVTEKVNTREIIQKTAEKMNCYVKDADEIIRVHLYSVIYQELSEGKEVSIAPFGKFYLKDAARPQIGGQIRKIIKFKASRGFQSEIDEIYKNKGDV